MNFAILSHLLKEKYSRYAKRVIRCLKRWPKEAIPFGDDCPLKNCWEVVIFVQRTQEPLDWELWEESIRDCCRGFVERMSLQEQTLLWLGTDECVAYDAVDVPHGEPVQDTITAEIYDHVMSEANNCVIPKRLQKYIDEDGLREVDA